MDTFSNKQPQSKTGKKQLREERLLIEVIRRHSYEEIRNDLREALGKEPAEVMVKEYFDKLIDELYKTGEMDKMLSNYLRAKIAEEREQALGGTSSHSSPT